MTVDDRIDTYIAKSQPFARPVLEHVRTRVHAVLPNADEAVKWGMPSYLLDGKILLITAAFKAHVALNFWRGAELRVGHSRNAMGQFGKIRSIDELPPDDALDALIRDAAELSKSAPARRRAPQAAKAPLVLHPDFAAALSDAPLAMQTFEAFSASAQRDYSEWIEQAKQDATRRKRIATAVEWLSEGKRRQWKYEKR